MTSSGVYKITYVPTGEIYIGQSCDLQQRMNQHFRGQESNPRLRKLMEEKGRKNFAFEVIEMCEVSRLLEREMFYISLLKPQFNIQLGNTLTANRAAPGIYKQRNKNLFKVDTRKNINGKYYHIEKRGFASVAEAQEWLKQKIEDISSHNLF